MNNRKKAEFPNVVSAFSGKEVIKNKAGYTSPLSPGRKTCSVQSASGFQLETDQALPAADQRMSPEPLGSAQRNRDNQSLLREETRTTKRLGVTSEKEGLKDVTHLLAWKVTFKYLRDMFLRDQVKELGPIQ